MIKSSIGVLALQGAFREHCESFDRIGIKARHIKTPEHLAEVEALVMPGGESSAIGKLLRSSGLFEAIAKRISDDSLSVFGTCAGMILSARTVLDGVDDQVSFDVFDATVRRNAIGSQQMSFEVQLDLLNRDRQVPAAFIRPPEVESVGASVEVLATHREKPVLCRQNTHLFATFHPELTPSTAIHELFLENLR